MRIGERLAAGHTTPPAVPMIAHVPEWEYEVWHWLPWTHAPRVRGVHAPLRVPSPAGNGITPCLKKLGVGIRQGVGCPTFG
jgi:hypothetical protein